MPEETPSQSPKDTLGLVGLTVADKYVVESLVGEGGFAVVYRATHQIWKRPVALKVFKALGEVSTDDRGKLLDDFVREGALLAELSEKSASICQARDIGMLTTPLGMTVPYMVLEWLEGQSLERVLLEERSQGVLPRTIEQALHLLEPAAEGLALAHKRGIAHRDVKPANVFLLGDARSDHCPVKLLDFGIAKVVQDAQKMAGAFTKTSGQITSFTPAYGAPEQFSRSYGSTGPWTDVFALALVMVEIVTGRPPLDGDDFMQIAYASADKAVRPTPRTRGAGVTDAVEAVFLGALAVPPTDRYRSVGQFWNALRVAVGLEPSRSMELTGPGSPIRDSALPALSPRASSALIAPPLSSASPLAVTPPSTAPATTKSGPHSDVHAGATLVTTERPVHDGGVQPPTPTAATSPRAGTSRGLGPVVAAAGLFVLLGGVGGGWWFLRGGGVTPSEGVPAPLTSGTPSATAPATPPPPPPAPCPAGMVHIEGGQFFMGSDDDLPQEKPAHNVTLSPFCIDRYEVTTRDYVKCSNDGKCKRAGKTNEWDKIDAHEHDVYDPLCNVRDEEGKAKHPINCVDWDMADTYCHAVGGRLPTESEWEFAARGPDGRRYPWGDDDPTAGHLNACGSECVTWAKKNKVELKAMYTADDGYPNTAPVGTFPAGKSRYGLEDVVGNVWEWVADWSAPYKPDKTKDPTGPEQGKTRVIRGGAWNAGEPAWVRPTFRYWNDPKTRSYGVGFRCAANPT